MGPTLFLRVGPAGRASSLTLQPVQVEYSTEGEDAPGQDSDRDQRWTVRTSDGDYRDTNELMNEIADAHVASETLLGFTRWNGVSLWQFMPSYVWPEFFRAVELTKVVQRVFDETRPSRVVVQPSEDHVSHIWIGVVQAIATKDGVPVHVDGPSPHAREHPGIARALLRTSARVAATGTGLFRRAIHLATAARGIRSRAPGNKKLLFAAMARHRVEDPSTPGRYYDEQLSPLLPALRGAAWNPIVALDCPYEAPGDPTMRRQQRRAAGGDVPWLNDFPVSRSPREVRRARASMRQRWNVLRADLGFLGAFRFRGVPLMPALGPTLERALLSEIPECAAILATAKRVVAREKPDGVIATYETGPFGRAVVIAAGLAGIPSIGIMHGMILDNHYDYMHRRVSTDPGADAFVVPTVTCVWGPRWRRSLVEAGNYPESAVVTTGHWRYDDLDALRSSGPSRVRDALGKQSDLRVALILTAADEAPTFVDACLTALAGYPGLTPVIKAHPSEDPVPIRGVAARHGPHAHVTNKPLPVFLSTADLVIAQLSTVIAEAALFDRPLVIVNLRQQRGWESYLNSGVGIVVSDASELVAAIGTALTDDEVRARLTEARSALVSEFFLNTDGRAAQRVVAELDRIVAASRAPAAARDS